MYTFLFYISKLSFVLLSGGICFLAWFDYPILPHSFRKGWRFFLALFWFAGLLCGIFAYLSAEDSILSLMRMTPSGSVSIVGLLCVTVLPFLLSAFAVSISMPALILLLCFCKAFLFAFVSLGVLQVFGTAGWLFRWLFLFGDCAVIPVLYCFWLQHPVVLRQAFHWKTALLPTAGLIIGIVDYRIISLLLAGLIEF